MGLGCFSFSCVHRGLQEINGLDQGGGSRYLIRGKDLGWEGNSRTPGNYIRGRDKSRAGGSRILFFFLCTHYTGGLQEISGLDQLIK